MTSRTEQTMGYVILGIAVWSSGSRSLGTP